MGQGKYISELQNYSLHSSFENTLRKEHNEVFTDSNLLRLG